MYGLGRRKKAIAQVLIENGNGQITINARNANEYLQENPNYLQQLSFPFELLGLTNQYNVKVKTKGGGLTGQTSAIVLGIARALTNEYPEKRKILKNAGLLTRDARIKERKKYGLKKARKASQFSKR